MINKLIVNNYKSIEKLDLELGPLTIFIGPNNAGKTNISDIFRFLKSFTALNNPTLHSSHEFIFNGELKRILSVQIEGSDADKAELGNYSYLASFRNLYDQLSCGRESFDFLQASKRDNLFNGDGVGNNANVTLLKDDGSRQAQVWSRDTRFLILSRVGSDLLQPNLFDSLIKAPYLTLGHLLETINSFHLYNLDPSRMRVKHSVNSQTILNDLGDNLPEVLHTLHSKHRRKCFDVIEEQLKAFIPEISELVSDLEGSNTSVCIRENGSDYLVPSASIPDGVLKLIGILTVLNSPYKPPLIAIEEPENYVHPQAQDLLAELLKTYSEKHQLILTTHSPYFLSNFDLGEVVVVDKRDGKTTAGRPPDIDDLKKRLEDAGMSLGDAWYAGHIGGVR